MGPHCLPSSLLKHSSRQEKQTTFVEIGALRVKTIYINNINEQLHEISNNVVCATSKGSEQPVHMLSLIRAFACRLNIL